MHIYKWLTFELNPIHSYLTFANRKKMSKLLKTEDIEDNRIMNVYVVKARHTLWNN